MGDPRRLYESKDMEGAVLYAKRLISDAADAWPVLVDDVGNLCVNMTVGTVNLSSTASTITNAVGNPVNVSLTNTAVTVAGSVSLASTKVTVDNTITASLSSTKVTVDNTVTITGTVTPSTTASTITNAVANPVNVSLTSTAVTVAGTVSLSTTASTVENIVSVKGTGTAGTAGTEVLTVQGIAGMTAVKVDGSGVTQPISGTISLSTTVATINNAVANPVNVSLTSTKVTVEAITLTSIQTAVEVVDNMISGNLARVMGSGTAGVPSGGVLSIQGVSSMTPVDVALSSTKVTVDNTVIVSLSSTVVTIANTAGTVTNSVSTIMLTSKTLTTGSGTLSATNGTITITPTNRAKVYAISLTTTAATELICIFNSGGVANGVELWRATLMAPAGANAGLNLAVSPPNFLFQSRSGTAVSLSLNTATLIHYSVAYFDEA